MKGVISHPFRISISLIIVFFILSLGIFELNYFYDTKAKFEIKKSAREILDGMEKLHLVGDYGSSLRRDIFFSKGEIQFNNKSNVIILRIGEWEEVWETHYDLVNNLTIKSGKNEVEIHFGKGELKNTTIFFC